MELLRGVRKGLLVNMLFHSNTEKVETKYSIIMHLQTITKSYVIGKKTFLIDKQKAILDSVYKCHKFPYENRSKKSKEMSSKYLNKFLRVYTFLTKLSKLMYCND